MHNIMRFFNLIYRYKETYINENVLAVLTTYIIGMKGGKDIKQLIFFPPIVSRCCDRCSEGPEPTPENYGSHGSILFQNKAASLSRYVKHRVATWRN